MGQVFDFLTLPTRVETGTGNFTFSNEVVKVINKGTGAATTVTLPDGTYLFPGDLRIIKDGKGDAASNVITVEGHGSETIDGNLNYDLAENYGSVWLVWNGTQWNVITQPLTSGVGTVASADGLSVIEQGAGGFHRTILLFDAYSLTTTDNGTGGHAGGAKVYDFPQGYLAIHGVSQNWSLVTVDGTGLTNVAALEIGIGTTVATSAMATLTGTAEDIVTGKTFTLSSSLSALHQFLGSVSGSQALDGSVTAKDAFLNVSCSVATADEDGTIVLTGTVIVEWSSVGVKSA